MIVGSPIMVRAIGSMSIGSMITGSISIGLGSLIKGLGSSRFREELRSSRFREELRSSRLDPDLLYYDYDRMY